MECGTPKISELKGHHDKKVKRLLVLAEMASQSLAECVMSEPELVEMLYVLFKTGVRINFLCWMTNPLVCAGGHVVVFAGSQFEELCRYQHLRNICGRFLGFSEARGYTPTIRFRVTGAEGMNLDDVVP